MIRPEEFPVISERARREGNNRQVFHIRFVLPWIQSRNLPILVRFLHSSQDKEYSIDKGMTTDFRADVDRPNEVAFVIVLQNALLIPLAQVQMLVVVAKVRTGELRTGEHFLKSVF